MTPLARLPWRLVAASLGFIAAVLGAIATVLAATLVPVFEAPNLAAAQVAFDGRGVFGLGLLGDLAGRIVFPGWLVFAVLAEFLGLRSLLVHLVAFAAIALVAAVGFAPEAPAVVLRLAVAAAFVAGFLHWLVAGRSAGLAPSPASGKGDAHEPHG